MKYENADEIWKCNEIWKCRWNMKHTLKFAASTANGQSSSKGSSLSLWTVNLCWTVLGAVPSQAPTLVQMTKSILWWCEFKVWVSNKLTGLVTIRPEWWWSRRGSAPAPCDFTLSHHNHQYHHQHHCHRNHHHHHQHHCYDVTIVIICSHLRTTLQWSISASVRWPGNFSSYFTNPSCHARSSTYNMLYNILSKIV